MLKALQSMGGATQLGRGPILAVVLALAGCNDGDGTTTGEPVADGSIPTADGDGANDDGATGGTIGATGLVDGDDDDWGGTAFVGDIHGLMTFTFSEGNPLQANDAVGIAGGFRTALASWSVDEVYSPLVYLLAFPDPPAIPDTTQVDASLPAFDFGSNGDWITAGDGFRLRRNDGMGFVDACLKDYVVPGDGTTYPVYVTGDGAGAACGTPNAAAYAPETDYDVVLYGGEAFASEDLFARVTTPPALEVQSPALDTLDAEVSASSDLTFTWTPSMGDTRIVIRIVDSLGAVVSAHALDDGSFAIPASDLANLTTGPIDVVIARERSDRMLFSAGGLTVVSRHERWGYLDLQP